MATIAALIGMQRDKKVVKTLVSSTFGKIPHDIIPPRITAVTSVRDRKNPSVITAWRFVCYTCHSESVFMDHQHDIAISQRLTHKCRGKKHG